MYIHERRDAPISQCPIDCRANSYASVTKRGALPLLHTWFAAIVSLSLLCASRNPEKSDRPTFRDAILCLTERDVKVLLQIPQNAVDTNSQFKNLGGPLEAGLHVYMDLQTSYCH